MTIADSCPPKSKGTYILMWLNHSNLSIQKARSPSRTMTLQIARWVGKAGAAASLPPPCSLQSSLLPPSGQWSVPLFSIASYKFAYGHAGLIMYLNILYRYKILKYKVLGIEVKLIIMSKLFTFPIRKMRLKDSKTTGCLYFYLFIWPVTNNISQHRNQLQIMTLCSPLNN